MQEEQEKMLTYAVLGVMGYAQANNKAIDFATAMQQVSQMDSKAVQEIASNQDLVKAGMQVMQQTDPETLQTIAQPGGLTKIVQAMQNPQAARYGAKLNYIKRLKGQCPEGYELSYMAKGGTVCPICKKAKKGIKIEKEVKKHANGGVSEIVNSIKTDIYCKGGKTKKYADGAEVKPTTPQPQKKKKVVVYTDKEGNEYEYNDSSEIKEHQMLIKKYQRLGRRMPEKEHKRLAELNMKQTVSMNGD